MTNLELIEREVFLASLAARFEQASRGKGHCFFVTGEAGIGKTSLVNAFLRSVQDLSISFTGTCDCLFTPRPLAPLFDISLLLGEEWTEKMQLLQSRSDLFTRFLQAVVIKDKPVILIFEDVHWADEATLDFIKFLSRRITRYPCLFILTFRDNEINQFHPLRNISGDLAPGSYSHLLLTPLSAQAVQKLSDTKGYDGKEVFSISGGNPFYVNEILASYSVGVPDNIRNTILSIYNRQEESIKRVWQLLSVIPEGLETKRFYQIDPSWQAAVEDSLDKKILVINQGKIIFKHELYRRTIEQFLSPFKRIELNQYLLSLFLKDFIAKNEIERIVHYAKNSNQNSLVVQYAPLAAKKASAVGAHIEAAKLYLTAIEYTDITESELLVGFYESYGYECYLTNQTKNAIIYINKALKIHEEKIQLELIGNSLRFLSRLWWFEGNRKQAEHYAEKAIAILGEQPSSKAKAMAFSNMCQLKMLSDETKDCIYWGEKAIAISREINDDETYAHALNSMGGALVLSEGKMDKGTSLLKESLEISLKNSYHEHVARAYTNLGSNAVSLREYPLAGKILDEGINYCEQRDLDSWIAYMRAWKSRLNLETGIWPEAYSIAERLVQHAHQPPVVKIGALCVLATLKIRKGDFEVGSLLEEARARALETNELQRIVPVYLVLLEWEWMTGDPHLEDKALQVALDHMLSKSKFSIKSRVYFWMRKTNKLPLLPEEIQAPFKVKGKWLAGPDAAYWEAIGAPYEQALMLFEGNENEKRNALAMVQKLGADFVYEKMKSEMKSAGIKKIPRGQRESTKSNIAQLTTREQEILGLLREGKRNKAIAAALFISAKTVDHHISSILFKLDAGSRMQAVHEAISLGILK